jgi:hypothetical protein
LISHFAISPKFEIPKYLLNGVTIHEIFRIVDIIIFLELGGQCGENVKNPGCEKGCSRDLLTSDLLCADDRKRWVSNGRTVVR